MTDEELKQRWIKWGCDEEIVDQIVARVNDETPPGLIPEPFVFRHWLTYYDKELCLSIYEMYKSGEYGRPSEHKEYTDEEFEEYQREHANDPEDEYTDINVLDRDCGRTLFFRRQLNKVLKEVEDEMKARGEW